MVRIPPLLRESGFRRLWLAATVSVIGDGVTTVAVPLTAAVALDASVAEMGILAALAWFPSLLFSVHAGVLADRFGRRRAVMIASDVARLALLGSLWISHAFDVLTMTQLFVTVFVFGIFSTLFTVSENTVFVALVPPDRYVEGQALTEGSKSLAFLVGPALGGMAVSALSAPGALLLDAVSFLVSAFLIGGIRVLEPPQATERTSVGAGFRYIARTRDIREVLSVTATTNLFQMMFSAIVVLYLVEQVHLSPTLIGLSLAVGSVGGLLASASAARVARRIGVGRTLTSGVLLSSLPLLTIPLIGWPALILMAYVVVDFGHAIRDISVGTIFSARVPDELRSRVRGAFMAVSFGTRPLGALLGGALGSAIGLAPTLAISALGAALPTLWLCRSPLRKFAPV
ncbi:MFS transporter [Kibdelosporangium philippinense]|uniref:MFS transporter n=1 Tax=Kibdelosporangium philippinense TaxID=211113 RepID=A0ABS8ZW81_9PSEU|nr:MFS transporter [Kibdelosporangium philippinense]MCE7010107.1 MFS transporter [Kibdelosporangium philippinense]